MGFTTGNFRQYFSQNQCWDSKSMAMIPLCVHVHRAN